MTSSICYPGSPLYEAISRRVINNDICITFCNNGFVDMLLNWLYCVEKIGLKNYVIVSLDAKAFENLEQKKIESYLFSRENRLFGEEQSKFGSVEFTTICNEKPYVVNEILKGGFNVFWTDCDIVFLKNPFEVFEERPEADMQFQSDDDDICAGFFYAKSNKKVTGFFDKVLGYVNAAIDDQVGVRRFLADKDTANKISFPETENIDYYLNPDKMYLAQKMAKVPLKTSDTLTNYYVLDRVRFPNGTAYFNAKLPQHLGVIPHVIHNNCIIGHDSKKDRFAYYNLWFIDENWNPLDSPQPELLIKPLEVKPSLFLKGHIDVVTSLIIIDNHLMSTAYDKTLRKWNLENDELVKATYLNKKGGSWSTAQLIPSEGNSILYTAGHDKRITAWDTNTWELKATFAGHSEIVNSLYLHQRNNENLLFSGSDDGDCWLWDIKEVKRLKIYRGHTSWVSGVTASGPALFTCSHDNTARAWEISTGRILQIYPHKSWVRTLLINKLNGNETLLTGDSDGIIRQWAVRTGECIKTFYGHTGGVNALDAHENLEVFFSASDDGTVRVWNIKSGQCTHVLIGHKSIVYCLVAHKDTLYSGGYDKDVIKWKINFNQ